MNRVAPALADTSAGEGERRLDVRRHVLAAASVLEVATGLLLMLDPALVSRLLLGDTVSGAGLPLGRCFGIALFALGLACWPQRRSATDGRVPALRSMLAYNTLIALYLAYLGVAWQQVGLLLWPAVALHGVVAALLTWHWRGAPSSAPTTP